MILVIIITSLTLTFHYYDILFGSMIGHSHFIHAIHGRLCYIPIVLGAIWFGLRGGLLTATVIGVFSIIYIGIKPVNDPNELYSELVEIVFYFAIGGFSGILLESEKASRKKKDEAENKLRQSERLSLMGQMVASIAHEIKNPLGSIKGAVQILKDKTTPANDRTEFTSIIEKEVNRLDSVVGDYLSYAKPTPINKTDLDAGELLSTILRQMLNEFEKHHIEIQFEPRSFPHIMGDKNRLHQLFLNIIINAMQAMPDGGTIMIENRLRSDDSPKSVEITIADTGKGIAPDNLVKIFDPFFSTKAHGTGLGLATAKTIVDEHGGQIKVDSAPANGTTFTITLPVA